MAAQKQASRVGSSSSEAPKGEKENDPAGDNYDRLQNETELSRLLKDIRDKEREYSLYKEETKRKILRDSKEIALLEKENEEYKVTLSNAEAECYSKKDESTLSSLHTKLDEGQQVQQDIKDEKQKLEEGQAKISQMEKKIKDQRKNVAGLKGGKTKGKITITEGRVDKATKELCKKLEANKKGRQEIEELRIAQKKFHAMYTKMQTRLGLLKDEIRQEEEACKDCFNQREDYAIKRSNLEEREKKEQEDFDWDIANLQRVTTHDANFQMFVQTKSRDIHHKEVQAEEVRREKARADRIKSAQECLDEFDDAFRRITDVTGEDDVDVIVEHFLKFDADMFSTFTYTGELERQVGELEYQIERIKEEKVSLRWDLERRETERVERLQEMDTENQRVQDEQAQLEQKMATTNKQLDELLARAQESYVRLSEKDDTLAVLLEPSGGQVTYRNALLYLAELERKADRLLVFKKLQQTQDETDGQKSDNGDKLVMGEVDDLRPPKTPTRVLEDTPDYGSDSDSDGEGGDLYPLTAEDIKRRLKIKIQ